VSEEADRLQGAGRLGLPWSRGWLRAMFWSSILAASYFAFAPQSAQPDLPVGSIATHGIAFVLLTVALLAAYFPRGPFWIPVSLLAAYGLLIEAVQAFIPYRSAELHDLVVDFVGIAVGVVLYRWPVAPLIARWFR
jgi:VanZ family protein